MTPGKNARLGNRLRDFHIYSPATTAADNVRISCQVCWRTTRWHNGRTRRSQNPHPEEVFRRLRN